MASENDRRVYREGREAAERFEGSMKRVLTVSKEELAKREATYQKVQRAKRARVRKASR